MDSRESAVEFLCFFKLPGDIPEDASTDCSHERRKLDLGLFPAIGKQIF